MRKLLTPTVVSLGALAVLIILGWKGLSLWNDRRKVSDEIAILTQQQQELQGRNEQIAESLKYLNTQSYKDSLARQQDLQRPGEIVINLPANVNTVPPVIEERGSASANIGLWWKYFFRRN